MSDIESAWSNDVGFRPLCDVKGCNEAQTGEEVELEIMPPYANIVVRIHPCRFHKQALKFGIRFQITSGL